MDIKSWSNSAYFRYNINNNEPLVSFDDDSEKLVEQNLKDFGIEIRENPDELLLLIPLPLNAHILGLGERAVGMDRKRKRLISKNRDPGGYGRNNDPLYISIPFYF